MVNEQWHLLAEIGNICLLRKAILLPWLCMIPKIMPNKRFDVREQRADPRVRKQKSNHVETDTWIQTNSLSGMKIALFSSKIVVLFFHKNRLIRTAPSDLVQVPSKNVGLSHLFFFSTLIKQIGRDCSKYTICLAHYILIFPKYTFPFCNFVL